MLKNGLLIIVAAAMVLGVTPGFAQDKVYINGFDADYPPFSFVGKDGKPAGFDIDALDWIANEMGFKVKHQPTDWAAIVPTLNSKKIDVIASGMSITPERQAAVNFTEPYWTVLAAAGGQGRLQAHGQAVPGAGPEDRTAAGQRRIQVDDREPAEEGLQLRAQALRHHPARDRGRLQRPGGLRGGLQHRHEERPGQGDQG